MATALIADTLYTPVDVIDQPVVLVEDGVVRAIGSRTQIEVPAGARSRRFTGAVLTPGLVDMHIHGSAGGDVMQPGALPGIERFLSQHGVTSYVPTTVTAPLDSTLTAVSAIAAEIEKRRQNQPSGGRARPVGIHLEGPFISQAKRGVHPREYILAPSLELFERLWQAARGQVKVMTVAPEVPGAIQLIAEAARRGVCVSLGHSDGSIGDARDGAAAGARHATHTFNAMRPLDHREPGILGAVLTDSRIVADIIADGVHVDAPVVDLFLRAKGPDGAVLITDALSATGMPEGRYRLGSLEVEVSGPRCLHNGTLAGSVLTLDRAVRNVMKFARWDLQSALRLATLNPARQLGLTPRLHDDVLSPTSLLAPGSAADLVVMSPAGDVLATFIGGELAHES